MVRAVIFGNEGQVNLRNVGLRRDQRLGQIGISPAAGARIRAAFLEQGLTDALGSGPIDLVEVAADA